MIITSLLDTDFYKLTMMQAVWRLFPNTPVKYRYKCRDENKYIWDLYIQDVQKEINELCDLSFSQEEIEYLASITSKHGTKIFKNDFLNFLRTFKLNSKNVFIKNVDHNLGIEIEGNWVDTILFEVPILSIVSEVFNVFLMNRNIKDNSQGIEYCGLNQIKEKEFYLLKYDPDDGFKIIDFGTRRRFSRQWQKTVVDRLFTGDAKKYFVGTSNVNLSKLWKQNPIGTMAHEWLQAGQGLTHPRDSVKFMLDAWVEVYRGDLGIALTDVITSDSFFKDFDLYYSKLFDGVRQDSGDPVKFAQKAINHYEGMGIDPKTKTIVFSDGLNIPRAMTLYDRFNGEINMSFGIGTNLTNDFYKLFKPLNIVIKMTECNNLPVAKISDSPGKTICEDEDYVNFLKNIFDCK
jgi:nicotinate phosphoribosyltransferase